MFLLPLVFLSPVWCSEYEVSAISTSIWDDTTATSTCNEGDWVSKYNSTLISCKLNYCTIMIQSTFQAIECSCPYAMKSILDGVTISSGQCICSMSAQSSQHITGKATCTSARECNNSPETMEYHYIDTGDWNTGG